MKKKLTVLGLACVLLVLGTLFSGCEQIQALLEEGNEIPEEPEEKPVEFISVSADGEVLAATTTQLTLIFGTAINGLSADDITINHRGTGAAVAETLTEDGYVWTLGINGITAPGNISVSVNKPGYAISGNSQTVMVRRARPDGYIPEQVYVQGGTFNMGDQNNGSVHTVTLSDFYISNHEVTQAEWKDVMDSGSNSTLPVEEVTWSNAAKYCNALSLKEGLSQAYTISGTTVTRNPGATGYRLPTEAEWEYAARGGNQSQHFIYSGSNTRTDVSWYSENSGSIAHPVGTKLSNELGLFDMSGNVREWCWDWMGNYSQDPQTNPTGPTSSASFGSSSYWSCRVLRGGGYVLDSGNADYPFYRDYWSMLSPSDLCPTMGFRVARSVVGSD
jgi:formylglycine-generating enzyme required for sulfatase activity